MKKIIQYILLASLVCSPLVSYALFSVTPTETNTQTTPTTNTTNTTTNTTTTVQPTTTSTNQTTTTTTTSGTSCTGDLRTDLADAQACANLAEQQGSALGYTIDCKVEQLGLGGFTDPTSGKDYILNTVCSVNGSPYQYGAYTLAGFTAEPGSNAIVTNVNSGWSILQTELAYQNAYNQCGGTVYFVNGGYSCTAPAGTPVATAPGGSITTSTSVDPLVRGTTILLNTIRSLYERLVATYRNTYGIDISTILNTTRPTSTTTGTSTTGGQCYVFTQTLSTGSTGNEVIALTYALIEEGFLTQTTNFFDANVMAAVKKLQEAHATEILSIQGLTMGTGVVGEKTRAYLNSQCIKIPTTLIPSSPISTPTPAPTTTTSSTTCVATASVSDQKTGVYKYTFTKNTDGTYKVQLNNPAYGTVGDRYYVAPNFSFNAPNALDLNRQNQGWFNYLSSLPGTAEGNTFYQNMFGSFNNAYYDWDNMTAQLNAKIAACPTTTTTTTTIVPPTSTTQSSNKVRYIRVSVNDWETLPLALREITVLGPNNTIIKPTSVSATDFNILAYTVPANLTDNNENTVWMANKTSGEDLQVITYDLGQVVAVDRVKIMNYGLTDTRVFVIEVSPDNYSYQQIAEVRAQVNAPIADKGIVWGVVSAASTVGPIQY